MLLYLFLFLLCLSGYPVGVMGDPKRKRIYLFVMGACLTLFAMLRDVSVGYDTAQFAGVFDRVAGLGWREILAGDVDYERGFLVFCKLLSLVFPTSQSLIAVTSLLFIPTLCLMIFKNSEDAPLSLAMFVGLQYYANYMNLMRQVFAMSVIFLAYEVFGKRGRDLAFLLSILFASLFHRSALILLVLPFLFRIRPTLRRLGVLAGTAFAGLVLFSPMMRLLSRIPRYGSYVSSEFGRANDLAAPLHALMAASFFLLIAYAVFRGEDPDPLHPEKRRWREFLLWGEGLAVVFSLFAVRAVIFERLAFYFSVLSLFAAPAALACLPEKKARFLRAGILAASFVYCLAVLALRPEWTRVVPYHFFFEKP